MKKRLWVLASAKSEGYASDVSRHEVECYDAVYGPSVNARVTADFSNGEGL